MFVANQCCYKLGEMRHIVSPRPHPLSPRRIITRRLRVRVPAEPTNRYCVRTQLKYGSHVVNWMACKRPHNQYEAECGFQPQPGNVCAQAAKCLSTGPKHTIKYVLDRAEYKCDVVE